MKALNMKASILGAALACALLGSVGTASAEPMCGVAWLEHQFEELQDTVTMLNDTQELLDANLTLLNTLLEDDGDLQEIETLIEDTNDEQDSVNRYSAEVDRIAALIDRCGGWGD